MKSIEEDRQRFVGLEKVEEHCRLDRPMNGGQRGALDVLYPFDKVVSATMPPLLNTCSSTETTNFVVKRAEQFPESPPTLLG